MKTIIVSGLDRTGKTFIGECFSKYKYQVMDLGNLVREKYNTVSTKRSLSDYYETNKEEIEKYLLKQIEIVLAQFKNTYNGVVIVGARSETLKKSFDSKFNNRIILFVTSEFETRYKRYLKNITMRPLESMKTKKEFYENDLKQFKWGLKTFESSADYEIKNDSSLLALKQQIENIIFKNNLDDKHSQF